MENTKKSTFEILNNKNLSNNIKSKGGLNYLSWAYAWGELKKEFPDATYTIYTRPVVSHKVRTIKDSDGTETMIEEDTTNELLYFTDGKTCHVKVGVTVGGVEYVEYLPIMDNRNNAVSIASVTSTAVNKAIQRAFVKACARHGLGLYIYAGEDLPDSERIDVDFKTLEDAALGLEDEKINETQFLELRAKVLERMTALSQENSKSLEPIKNAAFNFGSRVLPNVRISAATIENAQSLRKLNYFLDELHKILDGR